MKLFKRRLKALIAALAVLAALLCSSCNADQIEDSQNAAPGKEYSESMRAFWMTYAEIADIYNRDPSAFSERLTEIFTDLSAKGFTTAFFHVRAFCDAFYDSAIFPRSASLSPRGDNAADPLACAVAAAHSAGMALHAWVNPYRVSFSADVNALPENSPAKRILDAGESERLLITEQGIYLDPSSVANQALIIDGVREILAGYAVDGIHIDDYFYPASVGDSDAAQYESYTAAGGSLALDDWRRANVNALVSGLCSAVKSFDAAKVFGVSPGGVIQTNYSAYYADVKTWIQTPGYCDYIAPQLYFGFQNATSGFERQLAAWSELFEGSDVRLYVGLALYKSGREDSYAGSDEGINEWILNDDVIARQIAAIRKNPVCSGFILFSYGDLVYQGDNTVKINEAKAVFAALNEQNGNG